MKKLITSSRNLIQHKKLSIPSSLHTSIHNIQSSRTTGIQRWSLQSLASMKDPTIIRVALVDEDNNKEGGKKLHVEFKNKNSYNANVLLEDLNCRLEKQHEKCIEMLHHIMSLGTSSSSGSSSMPNNNTTTNTSTIGDRKVIKAVNQIVTNGTSNYFNQFINIHSREIIEMEKQKIIKVIKNLEILHKDTFKVCIVCSSRSLLKI